MWNLKKGPNQLFCRADTDSQTLKNSWFPNETGWQVEGWAGVWDGNAIKFGCQTVVTTINLMHILYTDF